MLPVMLVSFTGAKLHFHVCGHSGKMYAGIQFTDYDHDESADDCCSSKDESSCEGVCSAEKKHSTCCIDLKKEITTDQDYNFSSNTFKSEIPEITLAVFHVAELQTQEQITIPSLRTPVYPPPPHSSKIQLLL